MRLTRLELHEFRSYAAARITFDPGVTVLVGPNGQGKTNVIEAIHRVATGGSHRVSGDAPLVRAGSTAAVVRCGLTTDDGRNRSVELELGSARRTRTRVDGHDVRRTAEAVGVLRAVLFAPEDLAVVRGDPAERRRFLDELLGQRRPAYAVARGDYERTLRQRNQLLKRARALPSDSRRRATETLDAWTDRLIETGTQLTAARAAAVNHLAGPADRAYQGLADQVDEVSLAYVPAAAEVREVLADRTRDVPDPGDVAEAMRRAFLARGDDELARGLTLVGPHRDELELGIGALAARGYASHGEAWTLALSLKLATYDLLAEVGDRPVVLLDDVFAELDETRRARLAEHCTRFDQVVVTAAVDADVPLQGRRLAVIRTDSGSSLVDSAPSPDDLPVSRQGGAA